MRVINMIFAWTSFRIREVFIDSYEKWNGEANILDNCEEFEIEE